MILVTTQIRTMIGVYQDNHFASSIIVYLLMDVEIPAKKAVMAAGTLYRITTLILAPAVKDLTMVLLQYGNYSFILQISLNNHRHSQKFYLQLIPLELQTIPY